MHRFREKNRGTYTIILWLNILQSSIIIIRATTSREFKENKKGFHFKVGRDDESCYETSFTALVILYSTMSITHILYTDASSLAAVFCFFSFS